MEGYFERVVETLTSAGYRWYETANFCLTGERASGRDLRSHHNLGTWHGRDYLGVGIGAVSTLGSDAAATVPRSAATWRAWRRASEPPRELEQLDAATKAQERVMLGLRLDEPLPLAGLEEASTGRARRMVERSAPLAGRRRGDAHADPARAVPRRRGHRRAARLAASSSASSARPPGTIRAWNSSPPAGARSCGGWSRSTSPPASPSGSKSLVERAGMGVSSSTVRSELAELETLGLLTHPHTSAGRVPTEQRLPRYAERARRGDRRPRPDRPRSTSPP